MGREKSICVEKKTYILLSPIYNKCREFSTKLFNFVPNRRE